MLRPTSSGELAFRLAILLQQLQPCLGLLLGSRNAEGLRRYSSHSQNSLDVPEVWTQNARGFAGAYLPLGRRPE